MTALYLFCAAVGIPLLLWFSFAGDSGGGDGFGNAEADGPLAFLLSLIHISEPTRPY